MGELWESFEIPYKIAKANYLQNLRASNESGVNDDSNVLHHSSTAFYHDHSWKLDAAENQDYDPQENCDWIHFYYNHNTKQSTWQLPCPHFKVTGVNNLMARADLFL